jgi:hypothetical protein
LDSWRTGTETIADVSEQIRSRLVIIFGCQKESVSLRICSERHCEITEKIVANTEPIMIESIDKDDLSSNSLALFCYPLNPLDCPIFFPAFSIHQLPCYLFHFFLAWILFDGELSLD